jgi:hypothetical protein
MKRHANGDIVGYGRRRSGRKKIWPSVAKDLAIPGSPIFLLHMRKLGLYREQRKSKSGQIETA